MEGRREFEATRLEAEKLMLYVVEVNVLWGCGHGRRCLWDVCVEVK